MSPILTDSWTPCPMMLTVCHCGHPLGDAVLVLLFPGACEACVRVMPCIINRPNIARAGTVMWRRCIGCSMFIYEMKGPRESGERGRWRERIFCFGNNVVPSESVRGSVNYADHHIFLFIKSNIIWCHVCQFCLDMYVNYVKKGYIVNLLH